MNVRTLCLSILHEGEASGYEIRKLCTESAYAYFVEASFGSIYPALAKLEADGLVSSRVQQQEGKPSKKVFSITRAGREAFVDGLFEPIEADVFRSPFLLFARFAHLLPASLVEERLKARIAQLDSGIEDLRHLARNADRARHAPDAWVVRHGITCLEAARASLETTMDELIALARPDRAAAE